MQNVEEAIRLLTEGEVVAIPTETVYGLACNALNINAVSKVFEIKNRPSFDPLIVHISSLNEVEKYAVYFPDPARKLASRFWPGPLTLILPKKGIIPDMVTSGLEYVGLRVPNHSLSLELLKNLPFPLAAPSANPFGYVSPTTANHVKDQLGTKIPLILDGGPSVVGLESTIVMFRENSPPELLRLGGISADSIRDLIGEIKVNIASHSKPHSPGKLDKHYATTTPFRWYSKSFDINSDGSRCGALVFKDHLKGIPKENQIVLSESGDVNEAARNLFSSMRALDKRNFSVIYAGDFPQSGLGAAINDRLGRAIH